MKHQRQGFTLIEIIIVIILTGLITLVFSQVVVGGMKAWLFLKGQKQLSMETDTALRRITREIRSAPNHDAAIITYNATQCAFVDGSGNTVNYSQSGTDLLRNNEVMLKNLSSTDGLRFAYLNATGEAATSKNQIYSVVITLKTEQGTGRSTLRSTAGLRNP